MALMMGTLYEALVEGGTSTETAKKAAEEVAGYQNQPGGIRTDLAWAKALLGVIVAGVAALVVRTFFG